MLFLLINKQTEKFKLTEPENFHYLNQSNCTSDPTLNDKEDWDALDVSCLKKFNDLKKTNNLNLVFILFHMPFHNQEFLKF